MPQLDRSLLQQRAQKLADAAEELKRHFVGIDEPIDAFIQALRVWYIMPEALTRPVIINLWGMTGVGKTDMIRRLVRILGLQQRFIEVELANDDGTRWFSSVEEVLRENNLDDAEPKIVLFDEIQRFRTLDSEGEPLRKVQFTDFWELLSDGRLSRRQREDLDSLMLHYERRARGRRTKDDGEEDDEMTAYEARRIKRALGLRQGLSEILDMEGGEILQQFVRADRPQMYEPVDHSKTLILISGNLDQAFEMAGRITESDVDADIFHAFTRQVTLIDIKRALAKRFKPEQVARFGNIHILYRGLRRVDFEVIIQREIERVQNTTCELFGLEVKVSGRVADLIYRNGVFPVQGVRPVFSSVGDILESNLSHFILHAVAEDLKQLAIDYGDGGIRVVFEDGSKLCRPYVGRIDQARDNAVEDVVTNVAVHETGHAVAYMVLFGLVPLQLVCKVADTHTAGFTFPHRIHPTHQSLLHKASVLLAGGLAEEMLFGLGHTSTGRSLDRAQATEIALDFLRRYGFHPSFRASYVLEDEHEMDTAPTDQPAESLLARLEEEVMGVLKANRPLLLDLTTALTQTGSLSPEVMAKIAGDHGLSVVVRPEGYLHVAPYASMLGVTER